MRHVDEGLLHAYIDGAFEAGTAERHELEAHLAACGDCRVRLDDARRMRDRAQGVLDAAVPRETEAPSWESIVAEHARRRGAGSAPAAPAARPGPRVPLAWAASVLLAIGAGWMARAMVAERPPMQAEMAASAAGTPQEDLNRAAVTEAAPPPPVRPATPVETEPGALRDATAEPPQRTADADEARRAAATAPQRQERLEVLGAQAANAKAETIAPAAAHLGMAGRAAAADRAAGFAPAPRLSLEMAADSAGDQWLATEIDAVAAMFEGEPVRVEGMVPDSIQLATVAGVPIARTVYVLADGVVELIQRPARTGEHAPAPLAEAEVPVRIVRGIEVLVRGAPDAAVREVQDRVR